MGSEKVKLGGDIFFGDIKNMSKWPNVGDIRVSRKVYQQEEFLEVTDYAASNKKNISQVLRARLKQCHLGRCLLSVIPALDWLPYYNWKTEILSDIISGLTVAVMHIPQGLAYAHLSNVAPIVGIYTAFFPVLIYFIFGTSKHVSMGTFAVVCLMTGKVVSQLSTVPSHDSGNSTDTASINNGSETHYTPIEVATAVTFMVGLYQIAMYILRLGVISTLLSETLVNGFTTGSACHVLSTQIIEILGITLQKRKGWFRLVHLSVDIGKNISSVNYAAIITSAIAIPILVFNNEVLKPIVSKRSRMPVPIELIAVIIGTIVSYYCNLSATYNLKVVGVIPTGLPLPALPTLSLLQAVAVDSIVITLVSYTITISMALIFSKKLGYEIDSNQEALAMGAGNIFGSFFSCVPVTASLSRSLIQEAVGGKTQVASLVSCSILVFVLLWIGPCFEQLPRCVLASIIVVALKGMFTQAKALVRFWHLSKLDALVWLVTFSTVVIVDIDIGLVAGLVLSIIIIIWKGFVPYTCLLGVIPNTDLYVDIKRHKKAEEIDGIKIFHYSGGISFAQCDVFRSLMTSRIELDPIRVMTNRNRERIRRKIATDTVVENGELDYLDEGANVPFKCLIWDLSACSYIDPAGAKLFKGLSVDFHQIGVATLITGTSGPVFEMLKKCNIYEKGPSYYLIFPTVHDAVLYAQATVLKSKR